tara:strand:- start:3092 stop:3253 length:162 start_codon:yes stop_codon:yes gene_type:complete
MTLRLGFFQTVILSLSQDPSATPNKQQKLETRTDVRPSCLRETSAKQGGAVGG